MLPAPTVPSPQTEPGRLRHKRRAVSRGGNQDKSRPRFLRGPKGAEAQSSFPAGSPSGPKPWRFAAWQIRNRSPSSRFGGSSGRSLWSRVRQDPGPKPWFRLASPWTEILGSRRFAAPGPKPGPARRTRSRSSLSAGGNALTEAPLLPGQVLNRSPVSRLTGS